MLLVLWSLPHLSLLAEVIRVAQGHAQHQLQEKAAQTRDQRGLRDSRSCSELHPPSWLVWSDQPHSHPEQILHVAAIATHAGFGPV